MTSYDAPTAPDSVPAEPSEPVRGSDVRGTGLRGTDDGGDSDRRPRRKSGGIGRFLRDVALILVAAIIISFLIKTFLIRSFYIPSESMEPTLHINDRIIVNELTPELMPLQHGDVVVFKDPGGWLTDLPPAPQENPVAAFFDWLGSIVGLTAPDSNDHLIKRVIGLPGDTVACCNEFGQMTVNGVPLEEPYTQLIGDSTAASSIEFSVKVPKDSLWVMGDNRNNSEDSRFHQDQPGKGFVPYSDVVGRAVLISWPVDRWTLLDDYPFVFTGVDDAKGDPGSDQPSVTPTATPTPGAGQD